MNPIGFTPLDLQTWPRREQFYYFSKMAPTGYSLTVELDITDWLNILKAASLKFFPAYVWLVTRTLNRQIAFKVAEKEGQIGYYDALTPLYAAFHEEDKTFSLMWTDYDEDFGVFYQAYLADQKRYGHNRGILAKKDQLPPENAYTVSCVPWIAFQAFSVHTYENKPYYFPSVEAGQFYEKAGRRVLPLALTCHHATTDGYHVACFLDTLQADARTFEKFLF